MGRRPQVAARPGSAARRRGGLAAAIFYDVTAEVGCERRSKRGLSGPSTPPPPGGYPGVVDSHAPFVLAALPFYVSPAPLRRRLTARHEETPGISAAGAWAG